MNQEIKTSLGVIIILIVFATAGMFFWQIKKNNPPKNQPTLPPAAVPIDQTADWQTYRNDINNFEIKFPSNFTLSEIDIFNDREIILEGSNGERINIRRSINKTSDFRRFNCFTSGPYELFLGSLKAERYIWNKGYTQGFCDEIDIINRNENDPEVPVIFTVFQDNSGYDFEVLAYKLFKQKDVLDQILSTLKFTASEYCTKQPKPTDIGRDIYPINIDTYGDIGYLGELFTADDCESARVSLIFGVDDNNYTLHPDIGLRDIPSKELLLILQSIGFEPGSTCSNSKNNNNCMHWTLKKTVTLKEILKLKPYAKEIKSSGCINCG